MHLCLRECPYPARCPLCGTCTPAAGACRECRIAAATIPPRPKGRGLEGVRRELGL
jgi:hypothetical protein